MPDAAAYLRGVVDEYQASYVFRNQVDFVAWEAEALSRLAPDSTLTEVHTLIYELFDMMRAVTQHDHLSFYTPEQVQSQVLSPNRQRYGLHFTAENIVWLVEPGSPATRAGFQVGDVLVSLNGAPPAQATLLEEENTFGFERNGRLQTVTLAAEAYPNLLP
ncbi:MAG: PDZ domain-containing protein [Chloroflexota bacterium]